MGNWQHGRDVSTRSHSTNTCVRALLQITCLWGKWSVHFVQWKPQRVIFKKKTKKHPLETYLMKSKTPHSNSDKTCVKSTHLYVVRWNANTCRDWKIFQVLRITSDGYFHYQRFFLYRYPGLNASSYHFVSLWHYSFIRFSIYREIKPYLFWLISVYKQLFLDFSKIWIEIEIIHAGKSSLDNAFINHFKQNGQLYKIFSWIWPLFA